MLDCAKIFKIDQFELALSQVAPLPMRAAYCLKSDEWLHDFAAALRARPEMSQSRRQEFSSGRHCAAQALKSLGAPTGSSLMPDDDGLPTWPAAYVGSISHCREQVVAVAGHVDQVNFIGMDVENVHRLSPAAINRILSDSEMEWVAGSQSLASLVFSAKEAIYKAYFPHYRRPAHFKDVRVIPVADTACLRVIVNPGCFPQKWVQQLEQFTVRYTFIDAYVLCCCYQLKPRFDHNTSF